MVNGPKHILVVDDDELARLEMVRCVEQQGHTAAQAKDGVEALSTLRAQQFDLVLLDLLMPEVDGLEVLRQVKEDTELKTIPVIVVTGVGEPDSTARCLAMGAVDYLTKPLDHTLLAERMNAALAESS